MSVTENFQSRECTEKTVLEVKKEEILIIIFS